MEATTFSDCLVADTALTAIIWARSVINGLSYRQGERIIIAIRKPATNVCFPRGIPVDDRTMAIALGTKIFYMGYSMRGLNIILGRIGRKLPIEGRKGDGKNGKKKRVDDTERGEKEDDKSHTVPLQVAGAACGQLRKELHWFYSSCEKKASSSTTILHPLNEKASVNFISYNNFASIKLRKLL